MIALVIALCLQAAPQDKKPPPPKDESTFVKVAEDARLPHLAFDGDGNAYVALVRKENIELAVSTDGGKSFGAPAVVLNGAIGNRAPRVSLDKNKRVWVSGSVGTSLVYAVSTDHGKAFSKPFVIGPGSVHAAAGGPGELHVVWVDDKKSLNYCKVDAAGKKVGKTVPITGFACDTCPPGIAVDAAGNPTVCWRESPKDPKATRQIFLSRSGDGGKSFAPSTQLNSLDSGLTECPHEPPAAAFSADGKTFAAAWMDRRDVDRDADVYWVFGPPGKLSQDTDCLDDRRYQQRRPALAIDADGVVWCAWEDSRQTVQRIFFTNSKIDANIALGDVKESPCAVPSVAFGGGKVAVAYQSGKDVGFRVLAVK